MRLPDDFEQVVVRRGERSGCTVAVAVHSTRLGPALGGARLWHYPDPEDAVADARRLAAAMTMKAAAAGLDIGGGKGVLAAPPGPPPEGDLRRAMLLDFGDLVESLGGAYVTAEDVGTGAADMAVIAECTDHVVGRDAASGGSGDPSPVTALGVVAAVRACVAHRFGSDELRGLSACVIGLGHVGGRVAGLLADEGVELVLSDVDPARRAGAPRGGRWTDPRDAMLSSCDVLVPCALGGVVGPGEVRHLRAAIVCGAANNVLTSNGIAGALAARDILYAPDFIANAGGLISVYGELRALDHERAIELAGEIEGTMARILAIAEERAITPLAAAEDLARTRLGAGPAVPARS